MIYKVLFVLCVCVCVKLQTDGHCSNPTCREQYQRVFCAILIPDGGRLILKRLGFHLGQNQGSKKLGQELCLARFVDYRLWRQGFKLEMVSLPTDDPTSSLAKAGLDHVQLSPG